MSDVYEEDALNYEVEIVWKTEKSKPEEVIEDFVYTDDPQSEITIGDREVVGYGVLSTHAPYSDEPGKYLRRVFYIPDGSRGEKDSGVEVDPETVESGVRGTEL